MQFHLLTRVTRLVNLLDIKEEVITGKTYFDINWHLIFDTHSLKDIDADILHQLYLIDARLHFLDGVEGDFGHCLLNSIIDKISNGYLYILDDDNRIHPDFWVRINSLVGENPGKSMVVNQRIDFKDFTAQEFRFAKPENMKVSKIDSAQLILLREHIGEIRLQPGNYIADSIWAEMLYSENPDNFIFIDEELSYYNWFSKQHTAKLPKILLHSENNIDLKSHKKLWFESDELIVAHKQEINESQIKEINPDLIISVDKDFEETTRTLQLNHLKVSNEFPKLGDLAYNSAMINILDRDNKGLVSFFTPIYNTGERLRRLYDSFVKQTNPNWEWVIVNDSSDGGKTLKLAESICANDSRVKIYDFREKSNGIIGESKYRAAMLCNGEILAEIDHDDYVLPNSVELLVSAFKRFPDAGFAYTDCVEILEDWKTTLTYPEGFCFGYGKYRIETHLGIEMNVNCSPNINPKTIRHIVGIPNHIRAWKRDCYLELGGHNRRLSIADDYELVVRTFLKTKFIKIPYNCYLQFIYRTPGASNTHELSRADIQRRVRSIQEYYNFAIYKRFEELGVEDWAYLTNQSNPLVAGSRYGEQESAVNYDFTL